jgi:hypothetical protein
MLNAFHHLRRTLGPASLSAEKAIWVTPGGPAWVLEFKRYQIKLKQILAGKRKLIEEYAQNSKTESSPALMPIES